MLGLYMLCCGGQKMNDNNLVSIIIPFYKAGFYSSSIVKSIANQTFNNYEVIIVDDGCGEGIEQLTNELNRVNIFFRVLTTTGRVGPGSARNIGLEVAIGRYIAFLDADDSWPDCYLEKMINVLSSRNSPFIACSSLYYDSNDNYINKSILPSSYGFNDLLQTCPLSITGVLIDRKKVGYFFFSTSGHEDYDLWLYLTSKFGSFMISNEVSVNIRRLDNSISSNKFKTILWHWRVLRNRCDKTLIVKFLLMFIYFFNAVYKRNKSVYRPLIFTSLISFLP